MSQVLFLKDSGFIDGVIILNGTYV